MGKVILKSMTDFVLEQGNPSNTDSQFSDKVMAYANFLKQPLTLGMFVPAKLVNGVWVVLECTYSKQPDRNDYFNDLGGNPELYQHNMRLWREYQEAKDRVLFERFELSIGKEAVIYKNESEDLIIRMHKEYKICSVSGKQVVKVEELVKYDLELTPTAQKQIGI